MKVKRTDNPQEFFDDLETLFKTQEFQNVLNKYIYSNVDFDIFSMIFIVYFICYIQSTKKELVTETVKKVIKNPNLRKRIDINNIININSLTLEN